MLFWVDHGSPLLAVAVLWVSTLARGDAALDAQRLGSWYTEIPIYRSGAGTNTVRVRVGSPGVDVQLTLSTNVNFVLAVSDNCEGCSSGTNVYSPGSSITRVSSGEDLVSVSIFPQVPEDTLTLTSRFGSDVLLDPRQESVVTYPIGAVDRVEAGRDGQGGGVGRAASLGRGIGGFYGLGIAQVNRQQSIVVNMLNANNYPPNSPVPTNFVIGFDIGGFVNQAGARLGNMHWGAVPQGKWVGDFNWLETNRTVGGSWALAPENIRLGENVVDTTRLYATLDPGFDGIYVPTRVAEQLFKGVAGIRRYADDPRRWTIPCNYIQSMSISIQGTTYNFNPTQLVQPRDDQSRTCFTQVQSWTNGSVAEDQGEIRLGTSFMSGVYSVIYYSPNQQFVGIAGKPGSVNDYNMASSGGGVRNTQLAGILIGSLLGALLILFVLCYARNRSTWQSIWGRTVRRAHRAQMNAVIRGTTIPPPMAVIPPGPMMMPMPGMMPPMMGGMMGPGMMGGMGTGLMPMGMMPMGSGGLPIGPGRMGSYSAAANGQRAVMPTVPPQVTMPEQQQLPGYQQGQAPSHLPPAPPNYQRSAVNAARELYGSAPLPQPSHHHGPNLMAAPTVAKSERHRSMPPSHPTNHEGYYSPRSQRRMQLWRASHDLITPAEASAAVGAPVQRPRSKRHSLPAGAQRHASNPSRPLELPKHQRVREDISVSQYPQQQRSLQPIRSITQHAPLDDEHYRPDSYSPNRYNKPLPDTHQPLNPRNSRPEYDHAPPGSATAKSLWNFGGKAKSISRGYDAVPRGSSTQIHSGDRGPVGSAAAGRDSPHIQSRIMPGLAPPVPTPRSEKKGWWNKQGGILNSKRVRNDAGEGMHVVNEVEDKEIEGGESWKDVERNREREGLGHASEWARR